MDRNRREPDWLFQVPESGADGKPRSEDRSDRVDVSPMGTEGCMWEEDPLYAEEPEPSEET